MSRLAVPYIPRREILELGIAGLLRRLVPNFFQILTNGDGVDVLLETLVKNPESYAGKRIKVSGYVEYTSTVQRFFPREKFEVYKLYDSPEKNFFITLYDKIAIPHGKIPYALGSKRTDFSKRVKVLGDFLAEGNHQYHLEVTGAIEVK